MVNRTAKIRGGVGGKGGTGTNGEVGGPGGDGGPGRWSPCGPGCSWLLSWWFLL